MNSPPPPQGRDQRFADLYRQTYTDVLRYVQRRSSADGAEDIVHEAFLVTWRRLDAVPMTHDDARAWLFGVARNCLLNHRRGHHRRIALGVRIADAAASHLGCDDDATAARLDLARAWERLRPEEQEVIALAAFEQLPSRLAAQVLGISPAAYRIRLHRARTSLRRRLDTTYTPATVAGRLALET